MTFKQLPVKNQLKPNINELVSKLRVNKGTNRSLGDTNMRFGTNDPHILLIKKKVGARKNLSKMAVKSKMAAIFFCKFHIIS